MVRKTRALAISRDAVETMRRLEGIVASAMDGIMTVNDAQRIILFNPAAEHMFGLPAEEALGRPIADFIPERYRGMHAAHIRRFAETGATTRRMGSLGDISGLRANGEEFPIEASISQVEVAGARIATVILRDITERKATEDARQLLAREIDHRAKNALAVVQALMTLTRAATKEEFVEAVLGRVSALGRAHSLLAQSRWEGAVLAQIIADETAPYPRPGQIHVEGPSIVLSTTAVQPMSLLIHELATNAIKYGALSVDRGQVHIGLRILPGHDLELSWTETGGPPVQAPAASGFGSTLVSEVATRQLAGTLHTNWPAEGLQLIATFPAKTYRLESPPPGRPADPTKSATLDHRVGGRVLVVEDETLIAMALRQGLEALGWEVLGPASTLLDARRLLTSAGRPDVAVLDVNLGDVLVYPLAEELQAQGVPIIFCTGYEQLDDPSRYRDCPVMRKPVSMGILADHLSRIQRAA